MDSYASLYIKYNIRLWGTSIWATAPGGILTKTTTGAAAGYLRHLFRRRSQLRDQATCGSFLLELPMVTETSGWWAQQVDGLVDKPWSLGNLWDFWGWFFFDVFWTDEEGEIVGGVKGVEVSSMFFPLLILVTFDFGCVSSVEVGEVGWGGVDSKWSCHCWYHPQVFVPVLRSTRSLNDTQKDEGLRPSKLLENTKYAVVRSYGPLIVCRCLGTTSPVPHMIGSPSGSSIHL